MSDDRSGVVPITEAAALCRRAQAAGEVVVMCHGCFDLVHPGHVRHLIHAASFGDRLIVTVTGDAMVGKGRGRPLIPQEFRAENLAALDCVDWASVSEHPTAVEPLGLIRPDVYVKGREYEHNRDPRFEKEKTLVQSYGGRVVFTSGDVVFSSTALISALERSGGETHARLRELVHRHDIEPVAIGRLIERFRGARVLVVGETILDTYIQCDQPSVASEGPLMTLRPQETRVYDGGAAIIARHLAAMGARPTLLTALPRSLDAETFRQRLQAEGVRVESLDVDHPMIEKQRFLVGAAKMMKVDRGGQIVLDQADRARLVQIAESLSREADAVIVADYGLGLFTEPNLNDLCQRVRPRVGVLAGDVSGARSSLLAMRHMDLLCPSEMELRSALHEYEEGLNAVVWKLMSRTSARSVAVTMGPEGLILFQGGEHVRRAAEEWSNVLVAQPVPSLTPHVVDALGCGDALLAAMTLTRTVGGTHEQGAILGSLAAAEQAGHLGNAVIDAAMLRRGVDRLASTELMFDPPCVESQQTHAQLSLPHA